MKQSARPVAETTIFDTPTHLILCVDELGERAVPFSDPKVRWTRCIGSADCLGSVERGAADGVVIGTPGDQAWVLQLLTAAQPLAQTNRMALFVWAPSGAAEPKALYRAGAAEVIEGDPVPAEDVVRLWARLEALRSFPSEQLRFLRHGDLTLDPARFRAWRGARAVPLSAFQIELLGAMIRRPHHVFTRDELAATLWAGKPLDMSNVRTCFRRLRQALNAPNERELVRNVRDRGYVLDPD